MICTKKFSFFLLTLLLLMPSPGSSKEGASENSAGMILVKHGHGGPKHERILKHKHKDSFSNPGKVAGLYAHQKGRKPVPPGFYASRQAKLNQLSRLEAHYLKQKGLLEPHLLGKFEEFFLGEKLKVGSLCDRDWRNPLACSNSVDTAIRVVDTFLSALGR